MRKFSDKYWQRDLDLEVHCPSPPQKSLFSKFIFKKMEFILKVSKVEGESLFLK